MSKNNTRPAQFVDFVGNPINVGDFIAYGKSLGRCAGVNIGVVQKTYESEDPYNNRWEPRITVQANQDSWEDFTKRDPNKTDWKGVSEIKQTTLMFSDRCIVVKDIGNSPLAQRFKQISKEIIDKANNVKP